MGAHDWAVVIYRSGAIVSGQIGGLTMFQVLRSDSRACGPSSRRKDITSFLRSFTLALVYAVVVGAVWPLIFLGFVLWRVIRDVRNIARIVVSAIECARQPAPMALRSAPGINWRDRGLLVMLRARYLRLLEEGRREPLPSFIAESPQRESPSSNGTVDVKLQDKGSPDTNLGKATQDSELARDMGMTSSCAGDVELGEAACDWQLAKIVGKVTKVNEEGIFRKVVMYL